MIQGYTNCESHIVVSYNNSGRIRKERNGTCYLAILAMVERVG